MGSQSLLVRVWPQKAIALCFRIWYILVCPRRVAKMLARSWLRKLDFSCIEYVLKGLPKWCWIYVETRPTPNGYQTWFPIFVKAQTPNKVIQFEFLKSKSNLNSQSRVHCELAFLKSNLNWNSWSPTWTFKIQVQSGILSQLNNQNFSSPIWTTNSQCRVN